MREDSEEIGSGDFVPWKMNSHESQIGGKKGWTAGKNNLQMTRWFLSLEVLEYSCATLKKKKQGL